MTSSCAWGIVGTGWISTQFSSDLLIDPETRDVKDVKHKIVAVASRSKNTAEQFVAKLETGAGNDIKTYGRYQELYDDEVSRSSSASTIPLLTVCFCQ